MVNVRIGNEELELSWEEWEARVRAGRIPPDAMVNFEPVTGAAFVPARRLESFRSLRNDAAIAWQGSLMGGPPPILTALLVGIQIRIWWFAQLPRVEETLVLNFTNWTAPTLEDGEVWRLLTMGILHTDGRHLLANMLWLAYTGWNLEVALGRRNLLTLYIASVLGGSFLSMYGSASTPSLGASGGVFGLIAASMVFGFLRPELLPERGRRYFGWAMLPYLLLMFFSGLTNDGTDNWSHFGGLVTGAMLAIFLDPVPLQRREGWNLRLQLGVVAGVLFVLGSLFLLGPRAYILVDHQTAERESLPRALRTDLEPDDNTAYKPLEWAAPAGWRTTTVTAGGQQGLGSPAPDAERLWSVAEHKSGRPRDPQTIRTEWTERLTRNYPHAAMGKLEPDVVAGLPGWHAEVSLDADGRDVLEWRFTTRGIWELHELWQVDAASAEHLAPLRDRLRESVLWNEPLSVLEARTSVERIPNSLRARTQLAEALAEVGEVEESVALWQELIAEQPRDGELWRGYLRTLRWYPQSAIDAEVIWDEALMNAPVPSVVLEVVESLDNAGRRSDARGLLQIAWNRSPKQRSYRRARRNHGLWYDDVLDEPYLPYSAVFDPVTGEPRDEAEVNALRVTPLSLDEAAAAGDEFDRTTAALVEQVRAASKSAEADPFEPLALLAWGRPSEDPEADALGLAEHLRTIRGGDRVHGFPTAFNEQLDTQLVDALLARVDEGERGP